VPVQNPTVMGYFEPAVKCDSDVVCSTAATSLMHHWARSRLAAMGQ